MKIRNWLGTGAATSLLVACASSPDKIDAAYVSPLKYESYSCKQIAVEMDYVGQETTKLYSELKDESTADAWQMGVGLVLFWPSLFFLEGGDGPQAAEYAQLSGEFEALRTVSVEKQCGLAFNSPEEIIKSADRKESLAENKVITGKDSAKEAFPKAANPQNLVTDSSPEGTASQSPAASHDLADATRFAVSQRCYNGVTEIKSVENLTIFEANCEDGTLFVKCQNGECSDLNGTFGD